MSYYLIRIGEGSKYIETARKNSFVAIGWNELPDLSSYIELDKLKKIIHSKYPDYSDTQTAIQAGQIARFAFDMKAGDRVLSPLGKGQYIVGTVSEYYYEPEPKDVCPFIHRRKVNWNKNILTKNLLSTNLTYSLGSLLTVFSLDKYSEELDSLIDGKPPSTTKKPERIKDVILSGLLKLDGKQFEEFISHLLTIIGFDAQITKYVGDKGIDVNGILNAQGLAEVTLRVQVKRIRSTIGNKQILEMRGALAQGEHACFITLSTFSKQAIEEAEAAGKTPVRLIDGEDLSAIILKNFDGLDDKYKSLIPIKRKKDFNIEEQFEIVST